MCQTHMVIGKTYAELLTCAQAAVNVLLNVRQ